MALANAVKDARHTSQLITWLDEDGDPQNLTGATLTGRIVSTETGDARAIDGTLAVVTAASGIFRWTYGVLDVGTSGKFKVQFIATYGSLNDKSLAEKWSVEVAI